MTGTSDEFPLSPSRAKTILRFLADGVDPDTGELLPADHILNRAEVVRALFFAVDSLDEPPPSAVNVNGDLPSNAGTPWTDKEDERLAARYAAGQSVYELAVSHRRTSRAIRSRLERLDIIGTEHDRIRNPDPLVRRKRRENTGNPWSSDDDEALFEAYKAGLSIDELAKQFERGPDGIEVRLAKLGFLAIRGDQR